jgi:flagellar export protein FliJ
MPKLPDYRLQALVTLRERKKEEAERILGAKLAELKAEQDKQRAMEEELERMIAKREAKMREYAEKSMKGLMAAQDVVGSNLYIERLKELEEAQKNAIEGQKQVVAQKKDEVEEARKGVVVATQDLKALEKHKEKWVEQVKKEIQAKEEDVMDEIAQTIFMRRDKQ